MQRSITSKPPHWRRWSAATMAGAVASAALASACCIGPLILGVIGLGGAGLLIKLEPYRPYFTGATLAASAAAFWFFYRRPKAAESGACGCENGKTNRAGKIAFWTVAVLVLGILSVPYLAVTLAG